MGSRERATTEHTEDILKIVNTTEWAKIKWEDLVVQDRALSTKTAIEHFILETLESVEFDIVLLKGGKGSKIWDIVSETYPYRFLKKAYDFEEMKEPHTFLSHLPEVNVLIFDDAINSGHSLLPYIESLSSSDVKNVTLAAINVNQEGDNKLSSIFKYELRCINLNQDKNGYGYFYYTHLLPYFRYFVPDQTKDWDTIQIIFKGKISEQEILLIQMQFQEYFSEHCTAYTFPVVVSSALEFPARYETIFLEHANAWGWGEGIDAVRMILNIQDVLFLVLWLHSIDRENENSVLTIKPLNIECIDTNSLNCPDNPCETLKNNGIEACERCAQENNHQNYSQEIKKAIDSIILHVELPSYQLRYLKLDSDVYIDRSMKRIISKWERKMEMLL